MGNQVDGRVFLSRSTEGRVLVPGTQIRLTFRDGRVGAHLGCNSLSAGYEITEGHLRVDGGGMSTTEIGCDPALHAQDAWFADFLSSGAALTVEGTRLTLSAGSTVLRFVDRRVANPDRPLLGTQWLVDTIIDGEVASSVPAGGSVTLVFAKETLEATAAGCTAATVGVTVDPTTQSVRFADFAVDDIGCPEPWAATIRVLRARSVGYSIEADRLTLDAGQHGLGARAG